MMVWRKHQVRSSEVRWRSFKAPDQNIERIFRFAQENIHQEGVEIDTANISLEDTISIIRDYILSDRENLSIMS
jgi:hypothetical protein